MLGAVVRHPQEAPSQLQFMDVMLCDVVHQALSELITTSAATSASAASPGQLACVSES